MSRAGVGWLEVSLHPSLRGLCSRASEGSFSRLLFSLHRRWFLVNGHSAAVGGAEEGRTHPGVHPQTPVEAVWPGHRGGDSLGTLPSGVFQGSLLIPTQSELLPLPPGQWTCAFLPLLFSSPASVGLQLCIESKEFCCLFPGGFRLLLHRQTGRRMFPTQATAPPSQASQEGGLPYPLALGFDLSCK